MGENSKIEWTDATDNVIVVRGEEGQPHGWYCQKVSPGCTNCYAESLNGTSFYNGNGLKYRVMPDGSTPPLMLREDILAGWARKGKPKRRFVNSMTDTFGEFVPEEWIFQILDAMAAAPAQTFQVLTKRAERAKVITDSWLWARGLSMLPGNIWMGVSVESQEWADKRIPHLLKVPARIRFLSMEPLLGPVDLSEYLACKWESQRLPTKGKGIGFPESTDYARLRAGVDWVIGGGESGHNARPMHPDWARSIRDQCQAAGVPFFFKQWGEWYPVAAQYGDDDLTFELDDDLGTRLLCLGNDGFIFSDGDFWCGFQPYPSSNPWFMAKAGKRTAGRLLDGREWSEFPIGEMRR